MTIQKSLTVRDDKLDRAGDILVNKKAEMLDLQSVA